MTDQNPPSKVAVTQKEGLTNGVSASIRKLVRRLKERGGTAVFFGAGISRDSGIPLAAETIDYIFSRLGASSNDTDILKNSGFPFEAFLECVLRHGGAHTLLSAYQNGRPTHAHYLLAKFAELGAVELLVTTNFDLLMEKALDEQGVRYQKIFRSSDFTAVNWDSHEIKLVKLHGSIDDRDSMAATIRSVAAKRLVESRRAVVERLFSSGPHRLLLVLGYSFSDVFDISPAIESLRKGRKEVLAIQHSCDHIASEPLGAQLWKNPLRRFRRGKRLFLNTGEFVNSLSREFRFAQSDFFEPKSAPILAQIDWSPDVYTKAFILGKLFEQLRIWPLASGYFRKAAGSAATEAEEAAALNGFVSASIRQKQNVSQEIEKALSLTTGRGHPELLRQALRNMVLNDVVHGKPELARKLFKNAFWDYFNSEDPMEGVQLFLDLGDLAVDRGRWSSAEFNYKVAVNMARHDGLKGEEAEAIFGLGKIYLARGELSRSQRAFKRTLRLAMLMGDQSLMCRVRENCDPEEIESN